MDKWKNIDKMFCPVESLRLIQTNDYGSFEERFGSFDELWKYVNEWLGKKLKFLKIKLDCDKNIKEEENFDFMLDDMCYVDFTNFKLDKENWKSSVSIDYYVKDNKSYPSKYNLSVTEDNHGMVKLQLFKGYEKVKRILNYDYNNNSSKKTLIDIVFDIIDGHKDILMT